MNKKLRFILLTATLALLLPGAVLAGGALTAGGGVNMSSTSNPDLFTPASPPAPAGYTPDPSQRSGYNVGVGYEHSIRPWLAFAAELNLETRGENAFITHPNPGPTPPDIEVELRMLYLQLPVLAMVRYPLGPLMLGLYGGPSLGRLIHGERERRVGGVPQEPQKEEANRTDFGLEAGATVELALGPGAVFLRPGYYWGLLDFAEDHTAKHRVGKLRVGYKFFL